MILFQALMILVLFSRRLNLQVVAAHTSDSAEDQKAPQPPQPTTSRTAICWNFFYYPTDTTVKTLKCYFCKAAVTFNKASSSNTMQTILPILLTASTRKEN